MSNGTKKGIERFLADIGTVVSHYKAKADEAGSSATFKDLIRRLGGSGTDNAALDPIVDAENIPIIDSKIALGFALEYAQILQKFEQYLAEDNASKESIQRGELEKIAANTRTLHERILAFKSKLEAEKDRIEAEAADAIEDQEVLASDSIPELLAEVTSTLETLELKGVPENEAQLDSEASRLATGLKTLAKPIRSLRELLKTEKQKLIVQKATITGERKVGKDLDQTILRHKAMIDILQLEKADLDKYLAELDVFKSAVDYAGADDHHIMDVYLDVKPFLSEEQQRRWEENENLLSWNWKSAANSLYGLVSSKAKPAIPAGTLLKNLIQELEVDTQEKIDTNKSKVEQQNLSMTQVVEKTQRNISDMRANFEKYSAVYATHSAYENRRAEIFVERTLAAARPPATALPVIVLDQPVANAQPPKIAILDFINMLLRKVNKLLEKSEQLKNRVEELLNRTMTTENGNEDKPSIWAGYTIYSGF